MQSGGGIHHQHFDPVIQVAEGPDDPGVFGLRQVRHVLHAGGGRHDLQAVRSGDDGVLERAFALDHVAQVEPGVQPEYHVDIGQPQVGIDQHDVPALGRDRYRQIGRHRGFADAALAAGDGDHLDRARGVEFGQSFCALAR